MNSKALHAIVGGVVQGVSFRAYTQREALRLGLVGWVRNLPTGQVEVHAEGDEAALKRLEQWLHWGPPLAEVTSLDARYGPPVGGEDGFSVRR